MVDNELLFAMLAVFSEYGFQWQNTIYSTILFSDGTGYHTWQRGVSRLRNKNNSQGNFEPKQNMTTSNVGISARSAGTTFITIPNSDTKPTDKRYQVIRNPNTGAMVIFKSC